MTESNKKQKVLTRVKGVRTPEYHSWYNMMSRCYNKKHNSYPNYGGRGIEVCERWHDFSNFVEDMGMRPENLSLDRVDNNKGYFRENCKWSTRAEQSRNRRYKRTVDFNGKKMSAGEISDITGIPVDILYQRVYLGLPSEKVCAPFIRRSEIRKQKDANKLLKEKAG